MLKTLIEKNRSYRRFDQAHHISREIILELVNLARLSPSAANRQPLRYLLSWQEEKNTLIFPCLKWAGYLKEWDGPADGERPSAYIVMLSDRGVGDAFGCDHGIAAQSILLGAVEKGLGGCMIGAVDRRELADRLGIPDQYEILLVIALGKPVETIVFEKVGPDRDIRYYRDEKGVHHLPKRSLEEIVLNF